MKTANGRGLAELGSRWPYLGYFLSWFGFSLIFLGFVAILGGQQQGELKNALLAAVLGALLIAIIVTSVRWILAKLIKRKR